MGRVLPIILVIALMIYCIVEVAQANPEKVRLMPRWLWLAAIIVLPGAGALAWLIFGRPRRGPRPGQPPARPIAPDDNPDFLRKLR